MSIENSLIVMVDGLPLNIYEVDFAQLDTSNILLCWYNLANPNPNSNPNANKETTIINSEKNKINYPYINKYEDINIPCWICNICNNGNLASSISCVNCNKSLPETIISIITIFELVLVEIDKYFVIEHLPNLFVFLQIQLKFANKLLLENIFKSHDILGFIFMKNTQVLKNFLQNIIINKSYNSKVIRYHSSQYEDFINRCITVYTNAFYIEFNVIKNKKI